MLVCLTKDKSPQVFWPVLVNFVLCPSKVFRGETNIVIFFFIKLVDVDTNHFYHYYLTYEECSISGSNNYKLCFYYLHCNPCCLFPLLFILIVFCFVYQCKLRVPIHPEKLGNKQFLRQGGKIQMS